MSWYAAYDRNHQLLGTFHVTDGSRADEDLRRYKWAQLVGTERISIGSPLNLNEPSNALSRSQLYHVIVKREEVWNGKRDLFNYVTLLNELDPTAMQPMDPKLNWYGATFVSLGTPLMCEYCPDRKERS